MADLLFVVILVAFFALAALLVRACALVVGIEEPEPVHQSVDTEGQVAA